MINVDWIKTHNWDYNKMHYTYLQAEGGVILLEDDIPDIHCTIHLGDEEHGGTDGTPAAIRQVRCVLSVSNIKL